MSHLEVRKIVFLLVIVGVKGFKERSPGYNDVAHFTLQVKEVLRPKLHSENDLAQAHAAG